MIEMTENTRITEETYDRDARHYEFDLAKVGFEYDVGDVLAIHPHNQTEGVLKFLDSIKVNPNGILNIEKLSSENIMDFNSPVSW